MDFPGHFQHIFRQLNQQRLNAQLCDCVVVVGAHTFQAHRSILAACSSHFNALLTSSNSGDEGGGGVPCVMTLDPEVVTPEAFSTLLDMIYTSTLSLMASNVMDVLLAASHLHLNAVVKACKLHLSRRNFPAAPPKGWRSVQQQQRLASQVTSVIVEDDDKEEVGVEVSQSSGDEVVEVMKIMSDEPLRRKRKSEDEMVNERKRASWAGENDKEGSPTVTRSTVGTEEPYLLSPDCLKTMDRLWEDQCGDDDEEEEKYEARKGELEEIQLPSQSDSSIGGGGLWDKTHDADRVKIKVSEEEKEEPKMPVIEVKEENTSSFSSDFDILPKNSPPSPLQDCTDNLEAPLSDEKMTTAGPAEGEDGSALQPQLCTNLHSDTEREDGDLGGESVDDEGLESLSELAFSCFLNPSNENVMGGLEEDDSLASLTAAATAAAAAAASDPSTAPPNAEEQNQNTEEANLPCVPASDSTSSLVFPVTSVPFQQLLSAQTTSFSDTIILQPAPNSLAGFLSGIQPGLSLEASLSQPSKAGKSLGATTFRRIAPKVQPGSETSTDPPGSAGDAEKPPLARASEDVLSKCKKAAGEELVLLVEGEKKYACKICSKTFMNLTDCKKHIRVHTGEKPYPCPKCGKRFSQSSHLYKHSKNTCLNWKEDPCFPDTQL